jgi:hypothetical protein
MTFENKKIPREQFIQETMLWARETYYLPNMTKEFLRSEILRVLPGLQEFTISTRNLLSDTLRYEFDARFQRRPLRAFKDVADPL